MALRTKLPARWLGNVAARLALASGVGYVAAAYAISRFLVKPRRRPMQATPAELGLDFRTIEVPTADGLSLQGWCLEPAFPRATVALFHGMRRNRQSMLSRLPFLVEAGYRVVLVDHRAHGESGGKQVSFGWYESEDVLAVDRWIAEEFPNQPRAALGVSMGAAAICVAGPRAGWAGIVFEGMYPELTVAFRRRIGAYYPAWFHTVYPMVIWLTQKKLQMRIDHLQPVQLVSALDATPKLFITGTKDQLAPPEDLQRLLQAAGPRSESYLVPGAGHNDVPDAGGAAYRERVLAFLAKIRT